MNLTHICNYTSFNRHFNEFDLIFLLFIIVHFHQPHFYSCHRKMNWWEDEIEVRDSIKE